MADGQPGDVLAQLVEELNARRIRVVDLTTTLGPETPVIDLPQIFAPSPGLTLKPTKLVRRWMAPVVSEERVAALPPRKAPQPSSPPAWPRSRTNSGLNQARASAASSRHASLMPPGSAGRGPSPELY